MISFCLLFSKSSKVSAQFFPERGKSLYEIKIERQLYFDSLRNTIPDSLFFAEGSDYNEYMKFVLFWEPRLYPHGDFTIYFENNYQALQQISTEYPSFRGNGNSVLPCNTPWHELGPIRMPENGITWLSQGGCNRGVGPIEFIQFYKNNTSKMLCGSNSGGLFYSDDAGQTWHQGGSDLQWDNSGCNWALFHPNNPNIWYASNSGPSLMYTRGIYRTFNHGQSWDKIADYASLNNNFWENINKMVIDFSQPDDVLFVPMTNGLFKSINLSNQNPTFNKLTDPLVDGNIYDLEMKIDNHNYLVAAVLDKGNPKFWHPIFSQDGGNTWNVISNYPVVIDIVPESGSVTIETTDANPNYFYFLIDTENPLTSAIYRYDAVSSAWTNLSDISNGHNITMGGGHGFGISQTTMDEIYVSGGVRYKTRILNSWNSYNDYATNVYDYHVDIEDLVAHPTYSNEIWMASHGGVYKSINKGENWVNMSEGIANAEVYRLATSETHPEFMLIGLNHDGTLRSDPPYNSLWTPLWRTVYGGDGLTPMIDYSDPSHMWASTQSFMVRSDNYGLEFSFNTIASYWNSWNVFAVLNSQNPIWQFSNGTTSQYLNRVEVMRSWNRGTNRNPISNFNQSHSMINYKTWKMYTAPSNGDYLYAHVLDYISGSPFPNQRLFRTKFANAANPQLTFEELTMPRLAWISDLKADEENPNIVYITYSSDDAMFPQGNGIIYKVDYTNSNTTPVITDLTKNLPYFGLGFTSLTREKATDGGMYLGSDVGVFYTNNKLLNDPNPSIGWNLVGVNLPHVGINGVELNYVVNKLRVGTYGRGVWENDLYCPADFTLNENSTYPSNEFKEAENDITSSAIINMGIKVRYRAGEEIRLTDGFIATTGSDFKTFIHPCNHSGNSFKFNTMASIGLDEEEGKDISIDTEKIQIFPNPTTDIININSNLPIIELEIFNLHGQLMRTLPYNRELHIGVLPSGIYILNFLVKASPSIRLKVIKN